MEISAENLSRIKDDAEARDACTQYKKFKNQKSKCKITIQK